MNRKTTGTRIVAQSDSVRLKFIVQGTLSVARSLNLLDTRSMEDIFNTTIETMSVASLEQLKTIAKLMYESLEHECGKRTAASA